MTTPNTGCDDKGDLRRRAEELALERASRMPENQETLSPEEARRLLHELRVHQIELEMQNEELRRTQTELELSWSRYFDLYDLAPTGYCTIGTNGLIIEANLTAATLLGTARGALIQQPLTRFIFKDDQDSIYRFRKKLFETSATQACELRMVKKDGAVFWARLEAAASDADGAAVGRIMVSDITVRKFQEDERTLTANMIQMVNTPGEFRERMAALTASLQGWTGCQAVGIRLGAGVDYPYYETRGFPPVFVQEENHLCAYDRNGLVQRDSAGRPVLECMCGKILRGRFDPAKPFFTAHGSFWSNNTTALLAGTSAADRGTHTRNRCNSYGYESVALIPLRNDQQVFGLLQFNDRRPDRFTPALIAHLERMADHVAVALSRLQAAEALRESEKLYSSLFENMLNGFAYCRMLFEEGNPRDFVYLAVNEAFGALTGLKNVIGKKVSEIIPGIRETDPQLFEIYGRVALSGRPERFEMFVESLQMWFMVAVYSPAREHFVAVFDVITELKEKEQRKQKAYDELEERVRERTQALTLANRQLAHEIEERLQAEERLRNSKETLQKVFDGISDPLVLLDKDMRVKVMNKSAAVYYGITEPQKIIGEFCHTAFKGESVPCRGCKIPPAALKATDMNFERQGFMDPLREENVFLYILKQEDGTPAEIIYRISDITEKKVFEKRLIQNEKMASLGVLVSSVAHEINNPNTFISFNIPILKDYLEQMIGMIDKHDRTNPELELLNMSYPEFRQDVFRLVSNIEHGSERISAFVANLKEFSRIQYKGKANRIDLAAVAEKAVAICREKIKKTVKSFTLDIPENFPRIHADPMALEQILINLLINAAQAADKEDSWVRLSAAAGRAWLDHTIIEVTDNGCGIAAENMNRIFDPFFSTKTPAEGTGLGLYVCHNLVTGFGGRIEVESAVGEFSTFRVIIPDIERRKEDRT